MPRDPSGIYSIPPGTHGITNTTISSSAYNTNVDDVAQDLNLPRPIVAGGTGATTASQAITNLGGVVKTGDTMTGNLTINNANPAMLLQKNTSGGSCDILGYTGNNVRWEVILGDGSAETGSNAGSDFYIGRHADNGNIINYPVLISRQTGNIQLGPNNANFGYSVSILAPNVTNQSNGLAVYAGTNSNDVSFRAVNAANTQELFVVDGAGNTNTAGNASVSGGVTLYGDLHANGANTYVNTLTTATMVASPGPVYARGNIIYIGSDDSAYLQHIPGNNLNINGANIQCSGQISSSQALLAGSGNPTVYFTDGNHYINWNGSSFQFSHAPTSASYNLNGTNYTITDGSNFILRTGNVFFIQNAGGSNLAYHDNAGNLVITGTGYKPGGGAWLDSSDARIKTVTADYTAGLAEVLALQPRRFTYKGNDTVEQAANSVAPYTNSGHFQAAVAGTEYTGLVAQEAEQVMPELVTQRSGWIDGAKVNDLRIVDTTPLVFALINAVKELASRVEALEAR